MAKREISSTLKNLKFMQRAVQRQEKPKEEEKAKLKSDEGFGGPSAALSRKCIVLMEGDPHPGAIKGRMSFQSFNPSIDKLNQEAANPHKLQAHVSSVENQNGSTSDRDDEFSSEGANIASDNNGSGIDLKRKQPEMETETPCPLKSQRNRSRKGEERSASQSSRQGSYKQKKREKLDWKVLRPPKVQARRG